MLTVKDLVAGYRGRPVARLRLLEVGGSEAALLTGPSGAGKTTLLLAIAGLAHRLGGSIVVSGEDVSRLPTRARDRHRGRHIGMIFQDLHLIPGLSALDNLTLAPFATHRRQDRVAGRAMLGRLGIGRRADARAETLSRGEAQRTAIARAMLAGPQLILAHEPTATVLCAASIDVARAPGIFAARMPTAVAGHDRCAAAAARGSEVSPCSFL